MLRSGLSSLSRSSRSSRLFIFIWMALLGLTLQAAESSTTIRIGLLQFGTVNWAVDVMQAHQLAQKRGVNLKIVPLASGDASTVALQGNAVDVIVSDWIWVSRQRADGNNYAFVPWSNAVGSVMVKANSNIRRVTDLQGKSIGISGGQFDKTWLLLRAYANKVNGIDLSQTSRQVYAAPPLLNELAQSGQVDAALNVWHYDARLLANGMRPLIKIDEILAGLGVDKPIPLIGWVFREDWANQNHDAMVSFLSASNEAMKILAKSDGEWERIRPLTRAEDDRTFEALKSGFISGISDCEHEDWPARVGTVFKALAETGGEKLVGKSRTLSEGTFWSGFKLLPCRKN